MGKYIATVKANAVRNAEICTVPYDMGRSTDWQRATGMDLFIGVYEGDDYGKVLAKAAVDANTVTRNIRLISLKTNLQVRTE